MTVSYQLLESIAILRLDDFGRRNALSTALIADALAALARSRVDGARAVVIGSAHPFFCAGASIQDMLDTGWLDQTREASLPPTPLELFEAIENDPRPVVAAIDGLALGGGVELSISCDLAVASEAASFALPELGLGVIPNTALARLPAIIGARATLDLILTRRNLNAREALEAGLISRLVPTGKAVDAAVELARGIVTSCPPAAIAAVKGRINRQVSWPEIRDLLGLLDRREWEEGMTAFLKKRRPDYTRFWPSA